MKFCYDCANIVKEDVEKCPFCGGDLSNDKPKEIYHLAPGSTLKNGRYLIGRAIGYGGFGVTYAGVDTLLERRIAVKEYFPSGYATRVPDAGNVSIYTGDKREQYKTGLSRFLLEARNMAKFDKEPNIVTVLDFFEENNTAYIVMEYLDGTDLDHYLKKAGGRLPCEEAIRLIEPVCITLAKVHREGIIHRDISPDNIFLTDDGIVKLIDFGAARLALSDKEKTRSVILKQGFAPPEQYRTKSIQGAFTDIYALGATLYRMITGKLPEAAIDRVMEDELQPPSSIVKGIPENVDKAVMRAMAVDYKERYETAEKFIKALDPDGTYASAFVPTPAFFAKSKEQKTAESVDDAALSMPEEKEAPAEDATISIFDEKTASADDTMVSVSEQKKTYDDNATVLIPEPETAAKPAQKENSEVTVFIHDEPVVNAKPAETGKASEMKYIDMPSAWLYENSENEKKEKKSRGFPLWAKLTAAGLAVCMLFGILMLSGVIKVKPASESNKVTITSDNEHQGNYFVKVCAKPGTFIVYENSAGQQQEAKVSKRGCITFTVPAAALLPNEPIESDTLAVTPVIYIKNEDDGTLKQIENIEPVTLDVLTLTLNCENGDSIECENGMCLIKGKIVQTTANVFISVFLNNETVIPEELLSIAPDGSFEKELKFEAAGEYSVLIEAKQNGYKIERINLKAIVSEPPDPRKIVEIPDSFVTRAKNSDESIVVNGKVPVGTQIEVKSDDPEFSLKTEPTVDAEGNFSFEVNLPRSAKNYEMTIVATLSSGTVIERPFCVQRPPKYDEFVRNCWAYKGNEINNYANPNNQKSFAIKGVITEILEDGDYLKAKLTDSEGNTLIIIYYDHFAKSGKNGQKLEAGREYLLYGVPMKINDDGLAEVFIWFVND